MDQPGPRATPPAAPGEELGASVPGGRRTVLPGSGLLRNATTQTIKPANSMDFLPGSGGAALLLFPPLEVPSSSLISLQGEPFAGDDIIS